MFFYIVSIGKDKQKLKQREQEADEARKDVYIEKKQADLMAATALISLNACVRGNSNADTKRLILPSVIEYSQSQQSQLVKELESGSCKMSAKFIKDYGIMREQTREALK